MPTAERSAWSWGDCSHASPKPGAGIVGVHEQGIQRSGGLRYFTAQLVITGVGYNAEQPRLEQAASEKSKAFICVDERVLRCV